MSDKVSVRSFRSLECLSPELGLAIGARVKISGTHRKCIDKIRQCISVYFVNLCHYNWGWGLGRLNKAVARVPQ